VPARTVRFYQSQGLVPKPRRQGRDARYDNRHEERLRLVAELQDRGLTLGAIRDLLERGGRAGLSVSDWLGLDATLRDPWSDDRPQLLTRAELDARLDGRGAGLRAALVRAGYLEARDEADTWLAPSPALLDIALRLHDAGVDIELSAQARDLLRRRLRRCADDLVDLFTARAGQGFGGRATPGELGAALDTLRPVARETAGLIFAQEIERALRQLVEAGPAAVERRRR
jgi:DNA-binding transcriptional MerR regulator